MRDDHLLAVCKEKKMLRINNLEERVIVILLNVFFSQIGFRLELNHSPGIEKFDVELEDAL